MPALVKGYGMHTPGSGWQIGDKPVIQGELRDPAKIESLESFATATLKEVIHKGLTKPNKVLKGFTPPFANVIGMMNRMNPPVHRDEPDGQPVVPGSLPGRSARTSR